MCTRAVLSPSAVSLLTSLFNSDMYVIWRIALLCVICVGLKMSHGDGWNIYALVLNLGSNEWNRGSCLICRGCATYGNFASPGWPVNQLLSDSYDWGQPLWRLHGGAHNTPHTFAGIKCCGTMINISFLDAYIDWSYQYLFILSDDRNWLQRKGWSVEPATIEHLDYKSQFSIDRNLRTTS